MLIISTLSSPQHFVNLPIILLSTSDSEELFHYSGLQLQRIGEMATKLTLGVFFHTNHMYSHFCWPFFGKFENKTQIWVSFDSVVK